MMAARAAGPWSLTMAGCRACLLLTAAALAGCDRDSASARCDTPAVAIHEMQGVTATSPLLGQSTSIKGVVTAHQAAASDNHGGIYLQAPDPDHDQDPLTSEGVLVLTRERPDIGRLVVAAGEVAELGSGEATMTALVADALATCGRADNLPKPLAVRLPLNTEAMEGMLVSFDEQLTVTDLNGLGRYGQMGVAAGGMLYQPTEIMPPGPAAIDLVARNRARSLLVDDASDAEYPAQITWLPQKVSLKTLPRVGDRISGLYGVIDGRSPTRLHALQPMHPVSRPTQPRFSPPAGELTVAAFNVLNYFNGDGFGGGFPSTRGADSTLELERQRAKLIAAIVGMGLPDVLALMELENDGYGPTSAIVELVAALNERIRAPRSTYSYVHMPQDRLGNDEIAVGLVWRQDKVRPVGHPATLAVPPFDDENRQPLAQTFESLRNGMTITVVALHLKSKGCSDAQGENLAQGDGQGCYNASRVDAVAALQAWLAEDPTGVSTDHVLLIGDFNAYTREDPIRRLTDAGYVDLVDHFHADPQYTYIYRGEAGALDHALASPALAARARGARIWHVNADYAAWLDYNLEGKTDPPAANLYDPSAIRSSDHDPVVVGFE